MKQINFHSETGKWLDAMTAIMLLVFDADEARGVANRLDLKFFHVVFAQLKEAEIVKDYKGRYCLSVEKLYYYFGNPSKWC